MTLVLVTAVDAPTRLGLALITSGLPASLIWRATGWASTAWRALRDLAAALGWRRPLAEELEIAPLDPGGVLAFSLTLAPAALGAWRDHVLLALETRTPFAASDLVSACAIHPRGHGGAVQLDVWAAPVRALQAEPDADAWRIGGDDTVFATPAQRARPSWRRRRHRAARLFGVWTLAFALALATPWIGAWRAEAALEAAQTDRRAAQARAAEAARLQDRLAARNAQGERAARVAEAFPPVTSALARLTDALPDTAHLTRLSLSTDGLRVAGFAEDAAAIIARLDALDGFGAARFVAPVARDRDRGLDRFDIEITPIEDAPA
ncbi:MAG: PilN domain-containing protein [Maricaulaceae bacterium]